MSPVFRSRNTFWSFSLQRPSPLFSAPSSRSLSFADAFRNAVKCKPGHSRREPTKIYNAQIGTRTGAPSVRLPNGPLHGWHQSLEVVFEQVVGRAAVQTPHSLLFADGA